MEMTMDDMSKKLIVETLRRLHPGTVIAAGEVKTLYIQAEIIAKSIKDTEGMLRRPLTDSERTVVILSSFCVTVHTLEKAMEMMGRKLPSEEEDESERYRVPW
jgi:hypothetical protein